MPRNFANGLEDKAVTKSRRVIITSPLDSEFKRVLVLGQQDRDKQDRDLTSVPDRESILCKSRPRGLRQGPPSQLRNVTTFPRRRR
jgi:hypothetical protein